MRETIHIAATNSLVLLMDYECGEPPGEMGDGLVSATDTCIAIGTRSESEGETSITLTDDLTDFDVANAIYSGSLSTPNKEISICDVMNERLLTISTSSSKAEVFVQANDLIEPDSIVIYVR